MNVCFAALSFRPSGEAASGLGSQVRKLARALIAAGHSVQIVTLGRTDENFNEDSVQVHQIASSNLHWYVAKLPIIGRLLTLPVREFEYSIAAWKGAVRAHKSQRIDIIEGTETGMLMLALLWKRSPIIIRLHGEQYTFHKYTPELRLTTGARLTRVIQRIALRRAEVLISPSEAHASEISKELCASRPLRVIPNSVEIPERTNANQDSNEPLVLFVGRQDRVKGVKVFLEVAALVRRSFPRAEFVVAGSSQPSLPQEEIEAIVRKRSLQNQVRRVGYVRPDELTKLYERATVCVVPSYYESFGLAALEALAHGVPVIASRAGGLPEIVEDGISGRLVASGDVQAFALAILEILGDDTERAQMSLAARSRAQTHFSPERINRMNLNVFEELRTASHVLRQLDERSTVVAPRAT